MHPADAAGVRRCHPSPPPPRRLRAVAAPPWIVVALAWLALGGPPAVAEVITGRVVAVHDGDSITLADPQRRRHRIRVAAIDAPEGSQPYADAARRHLSQLLDGRWVVADCYARDPYDRDVCRVRAGERDVGLAQIEAGLAWWFRRYAREQPADDRRRYELAERDARASGRGLWANSDPEPPWASRRRTGGRSR